MSNEITLPPGDDVDMALQILVDRQMAMLPPDYGKRSAAEMTFDPRLAYELALELDKPAEIFPRYGYNIDTAKILMQHPAFIATVRKYKEEILEGGVSFKLKAKMQAEDLLTHSYALAVDPTTPPAVRSGLIQWTAKVAGLEPTLSKDTGNGNNQNAFTLNITFAEQKPVVEVTRVIEGEKI